MLACRGLRSVGLAWRDVVQAAGMWLCTCQCGRIQTVRKDTNSRIKSNSRNANLTCPRSLFHTTTVPIDINCLTVYRPICLRDISEYTMNRDCFEHLFPSKICSLFIHVDAPHLSYGFLFAGLTTGNAVKG